MTTRLYLEASGAPLISPAFAAWTVTTNADRILMGPASLGTVAASKGESRSVSNANTILERQFVSSGLTLGSVFTNAAVLKGQIRCVETSSTNNVTARVNARIMSSDGATSRATIRSSTTLATEFNTALRNISFATTLTAGYTTVNAGDVIVIEVGWVCGQTTTMTTQLSFGTNGASDLPEDETTTTALKPWMEFADTVTFTNVINWGPMIAGQLNRIVLPGD